jgi:hypothetical protein
VDKVSLLLHVIRSENLGHQNFSASCSLQTIVLSLLATLGHLLLSSGVNSSLFVGVITLPFS